MEPDVGVEILLVALAHAIANPGTVMVERRNASFALATMLSSQRLIVLALPTISELNVDSAFGYIALYCRLVLGPAELLEYPSIDFLREVYTPLQ